MRELKTSKEFEIRFSEVDSMNIVWHGSYMMYFEDAREAFGREYGIAYLDIFGNGKNSSKVRIPTLRLTRTAPARLDLADQRI